MDEVLYLMATALILTSNSPRHIYFANKMAQTFDVAGIISEPKNDYFEKQIEESELVKNHFENLFTYENKYLGEFTSFPCTPVLSIDKNEINEAKTLKWAKEKNADVILLFGTGILSELWLTPYKNRVVNLHLGYSPRYRGSATLFWPFVNDELEFVGATIHLAELKVDAGAIIKIITPNILQQDNYYDISFKTIKKAIEEFPVAVQDFLDGKLQPFLQKIDDQKFHYRKKDFTEEVLKMVMEKYGP